MSYTFVRYTFISSTFLNPDIISNLIVYTNVFAISAAEAASAVYPSAPIESAKV